MTHITATLKKQISTEISWR